MNRLLLACWQESDDHGNFPKIPRSKCTLGGENDQEELLRAIRRADFLVAHNAKFELQWLKRCGLDLRAILVWDTMLAEWVLLGNLRETGLSLSASCARRGIPGKEDLVAHLIELGVNPENIPVKWLEEYCHQDVDITRQLFCAQRSLVRDRGQLHLVYQRGLVSACLADIEFNGLKLDRGRVDEEYNKVRLELAQTEKDLLEFGQINWKSRPQVATLLYDVLGFEESKDYRGQPLRTDKGARSTNKIALAKLVPKTKEQRRFIELYKKLANLNAKLSKSLEFFKDVCEHHNGIFTGQLNQGRVQTHRLSSSGRPITLQSTGKPAGVQLQNLPREYKRLFTAKRDGWLVLDGDGAGLEFVVAAQLGNDKTAIEDITYGDKAKGTDIHSRTAAALAGAGEPTSRQDAKSRTFRPLYGGSSGTAAEQAYCKYFQDRYSGIYKTQTGWTYEVLRTGELRTPYGMIFRWPGTKCLKSGRIENTTSIFNFPVQGFATGEIIPLALVSFWHKTKDLRLEIVNTVHDSIISEVHPDDKDISEKILRECLTTDVYRLLKELYNYEFNNVKLDAEVKTSKHWGEQ